MGDYSALNDQFFEDNPLEQMSPAHLRIEIKLDPELDADSVEDLLSTVTEGGRQLVEEEKRRIETLTVPEEVATLFRKGCQPANIRPLCLKAAELQDQVMPLLLKRYRTTAQDRFIDMTTIALAFADAEYVRQLREMYPEIRDPYARANACLLMGEKDMVEEIPFLMEEHAKFKTQHPKESFEQYPLLALSFLEDLI